MSRTNTYKVRKDRWHSIRKNLTKESSKEDWLEVFNDIFLERFNDRYFNPAKILLFHNNLDVILKDTQKGNGFAIITILSSSIETLSYLFRGKINVTHKQIYNKYFENRKIIKIFNFFFDQAEGFKIIRDSNNKNVFSKIFYNNYRNLLFHQGMTENNFKIKILLEGKKPKALKFIQKLEKKDFDFNSIGKYSYKIMNDDFTILYRESFYYYLKYKVMHQIYKLIRDNGKINKINARYSMARLLDVIYSEGEYTNIDYDTNWWKDDSIKQNKNFQIVKN